MLVTTFVGELHRPGLGALQKQMPNARKVNRDDSVACIAAAAQRYERGQAAVTVDGASHERVSFVSTLRRWSSPETTVRR